jgi:serine/threonine-protein kinase HipA
MTPPVEVRLWGRRIGSISLADGAAVAEFEYAPEFQGSGIQLSPLVMPLRAGTYRFPELARTSFRGLPGLLADSLPDYYGNALIDRWLAEQGRSPGSFNEVERLCYIGIRGMGALEYAPATGPSPTDGELLEIGPLVELASRILAERGNLHAVLDKDVSEQAMREILLVGTSAGGARAKALVALNPETMELRSGQIDHESGFEYWILKFDGVTGQTRELGTGTGYCAVEYAYYLMATRCGIDMTECRLYSEGDRRHFLTRRFDRDARGNKLHMQTLAALCHLDYVLADAYTYEQAFDAMRRLGLGADRAEQLFRRMVFNIVARNQDDHVKNIAFLMNRSGEWDLSPAYDMTWAYNPTGAWTAQHQMSVNGKRSGFTIDDLRAVERFASLKRGTTTRVLEEVASVVQTWPNVASDVGVSADWAQQIAESHVLDLL